MGFYTFFEDNSAIKKPLSIKVTFFFNDFFLKTGPVAQNHCNFYPAALADFYLAALVAASESGLNNWF